MKNNKIKKIVLATAFISIGNILGHMMCMKKIVNDYSELFPEGIIKTKLGNNISILLNTKPNNSKK